MADVKKGDTVLAVGTRKGLFLASSRDRRKWIGNKPGFVAYGHADTLCSGIERDYSPTRRQKGRVGEFGRINSFFLLHF